MSTPLDIQRLDQTTANQIAAGEVVERPAAVVKELVENALDADATQIDIRIKDGGKTLIEVMDNGFGIAADQLALAIERHATSKMHGRDLLNIRSFGFRGEALPSIGAVSRLEVISRQNNADAMSITVEGGNIRPIAPARRNKGTAVTVRDLFYATPARLKFMSSDRSELLAIGDTVRRLAMARPDVGFTLTDIGNEKNRIILDLPARDAADYLLRTRTILGAKALEDTIEFDAIRDGVHIHGFLGLPTAARGSASAQYYFVNNRPVRDKLFFGAIKGAYADLLPSGKFPFIILYMDLPPAEVDINVHPAKTEIRFREAAAIRSFVLNAIRHRFAEAGLRGDTGLASSVIEAFHPASPSPFTGQYQYQSPSRGAINASMNAQFPGLAEEPRSFAPQPAPEAPRQDHPLGVARAQFHKNYIISETPEGLIVVDQHAAHERLVYEKLKTQYTEKRLQAQRLLVPEIVKMGAIERAKILAASEALANIGFEIEEFGTDAIAVQAVPAPLSHASPSKMVEDIVDALDDDPSSAIDARMDHLLATVACHGSVRSGRILHIEEMNALLREMEATPNSGTCNHGRPTFIKLDLKSLESRFGR